MAARKYWFGFDENVLVEIEETDCIHAHVYRLEIGFDLDGVVLEQYFPIAHVSVTNYAVLLLHMRIYSHVWHSPIEEISNIQDAVEAFMDAFAPEAWR